MSKESFSKNWSSQLQKALSMDASSSHSQSWVKELGMTDNQSYQKMAQENLSTEKSYEQASQLQQQLGQSLNSGPAVWANRVAASESAMNTLQSKPYDPEFQQQVNSNVQRLGGQFASPSETLAAALVSTYLKSSGEEDLGRLTKALQESGIISSEPMSGSPHSNQPLAPIENLNNDNLSKPVTQGVHQPERINSDQVRQKISETSHLPDQHTLQNVPRHSSTTQQFPEALQPLTKAYNQSRQSVSDQFQQSNQSKPYITSLLKHSAYGAAPSTSGPGLNLTYNQAFDKAASYGLTNHQSAAFASLVKDHDPKYERSAEPENRRHRLGQSIAEISRGWGDHSAELGQHAFNHLTHAADSPQHTNAALTLIGEMNRLYQPEIKQYEQSVEGWLKGQQLLPTEGNSLDTSMPPEHIGNDVRSQLKQRQSENNLRVFGQQDKEHFQEPSSRLSRTQREM